MRTSRIQFAAPASLALALVLLVSGAAVPHSRLRVEAAPGVEPQTADSSQVVDILIPLSGDLIARRRVLAQAEGAQDLMSDLEFGPAALLLEVPSADEDDAATRFRERRDPPLALALVAAIGKPYEFQHVIGRMCSDPDEVRLEQIS
jgi:hypothetical protein